MEAFFVIVMAAMVLGVGVLSLLAVRRMAALSRAAAGDVQDSEECA